MKPGASARPCGRARPRKRLKLRCDRCNPVALDAHVRSEWRSTRAVIDGDVTDQYVSVCIDAGQKQTDSGQQTCSSHGACPWDRKVESLPGNLSAEPIHSRCLFLARPLLGKDLSALRVADRLRQQHVLVVGEAKGVGDGGAIDPGADHGDESAAGGVQVNVLGDRARGG